MENDKNLSYASLEAEDVNQINATLEKLDTLSVIRWAYEEFADELVYACSFGAEGIVFLDLIYRVHPEATVVFLDTHLHFKETYELIARVMNRYPNLQIRFAEPHLTLAGQAAIYGEELWISKPNLCCHLRKVKPLQKELAHAKAWLSGLRREQGPTRAHVQYLNKDDTFKNLKICPLIHWTWDDIWTYIRTFDLPYNPLHDQGYPSIGCKTCTHAVDADAADTRSGRWAGTGKVECGLHSVQT